MSSTLTARKPHRTVQRPLTLVFTVVLSLHFGALPFVSSSGDFSLRGKTRDVSRATARAADLDIETVQLGQELSGKVSSLNPKSADIDFGLNFKGNIFVTKLGKPIDTKITDILKVGDVVTGRVQSIKKRTKGEVQDFWVELSQLDNPMFAKKPLAEFSEGDIVSGTVQRHFKNKLFVDVGAMVDAGVAIAKAGNLTAGTSIELKVTSVTNNKIDCTTP
eukprot:TRINITY_DN8980_c0_g2_i1.p1 TRINITY_DN8980_c0_g2~~TRINITY_DN8980_c0_g2_i1.p1  ORF type:complete len:219 (+),score=27.05 TRINITY_DN8980_c0_g2_i1:67-723(+)